MTKTSPNPDSDPNAEDSEMITVFGNEKFKQVIKFGIPIPDYYIAEDGTPLSTRTKAGKILKKSPRSKGTDHKKNTHVYPRMNCTVAEDWGPDHFQYYKDNQGARHITVDLHRAVMDVWRPIDKYPPDRLAADWDKAPESFKQWVRETVVVDHIDDDTMNCDVTNLRYCTPRQNSPKIKQAEMKQQNHDGSGWIIHKKEDDENRQKR